MAWGGFNVVQASLNAVALALKREIPFHWLWILSGTTYPIASNDAIRGKLASHHPESVGRWTRGVGSWRMRPCVLGQGSWVAGGGPLVVGGVVHGEISLAHRVSGHWVVGHSCSSEVLILVLLLLLLRRLLLPLLLLPSRVLLVRPLPPAAAAAPAVP